MKELTAKEKDILSYAIYSDIADATRLVESENMGRDTYADQINVYRDICEKLQLGDVVQHFIDSEAERRIDEMAKEAHDKYHGW